MDSRLLRPISAAIACSIGLAVFIGGCESPRHVATGPLIQAPSHCRDINFPIYFDPDSAVITSQADNLIKVAGKRAVGCQVTHIVVVGLADAAGAPGANLDLSRRRADAVTRELLKRGFGAVEFRVAATGAEGATMPNGDAKPLRRRADVSIHLTAVGSP